MRTEILRAEVGGFAFGRPSNVYLILHEGRGILVDTCVGNELAYDALREEFSEATIALEDVTDILLTHWHADHTGLAGQLHAETGATIHIHTKDAPPVRRDSNVFEDLRAQQHALLNEWGVPDHKRDRVLALVKNPSIVHGRPVDAETFQDGREFAFGDLRIEARHVPGHTAGHCCFLLSLEGTNHAFVGDTILPEVTPNVGGTDIRMRSPLESYRKSLERIAQMNLDVVWPGHDQPISNPTTRCQDIIAHHEHRESEIANIVDEEGELSVWQLSNRLFGELTGVEVIQATGEVAAHVNRMADEGKIDYEYGSISR